MVGSAPCSALRQMTPHLPCRPSALHGLCSALLLAASTQAAALCTLQGVAVDPAVSAGLQGKSGWLRCTDPDSGKLEREQEVQGGRLSGRVRLYQNGVLAKDFHQNERGQLHGPLRELSPSGKLLRRAQYDNGVLVGLLRSYHPQGQLQRVSALDASGQEIAAASFTSQGQLHELICADKPMLAPLFDDAKACGFGTSPVQVDYFLEGGALFQRAFFQGGRRVQLDSLRGDGKLSQQELLSPSTRVERSFGANGALRREMQWALTGGQARREREQEFTADGRLLRERRWKAGELSSETLYYPNGRPRRKAAFITENPHELQVHEYYDSGVLSLEGSFANTTRYALTPVGTHRKFAASGKLLSELVYDERGKLLRERQFDESGQLLRDEVNPEDTARAGK